ncbi:MAG: HAD family hydrolase [Thermoguttaceae bacterium]
MNRLINEPQRITGAILDLDGTLLDTMEQWNALGEDYLRERDVEPKSDLRDRLESMTLRESAAYFQNDYGVDLSVPEIIDELTERIRSLYTTSAPLKPGALETLRILKEGGVRIALATVTSVELARAGLTRTGAMEFFDELFSCREPEIGEGKTSPKIYDAARSFLGTSLAETIVVEDALYAIKTAKNAGYNVVAIEDEAERLHKDAIAKTADVYVKDHAELCAWLTERLRD